MSSPLPDQEPRLPSVWLLRWRLSALFLIVLGARFWLVERYASSIPISDQWDGELALLLKPWLEHHLRFADLVAAHNEHRVVLTRLLTLGLFSLNGQWDNTLGTAFNAVFCALSAAGIAGVVIAALEGAFQRTVLLAVALVYVLPFGWENTFNGFASQNYFLNSFSLLAVWGLATHRANTTGWWLGLGGAVAACLSMAGGFLASAATLGLLGARLARERRLPRPGEWLTGTLCAAFCVAGWLSRVEVPAHAVLKAESLSAFVSALTRFYGWPLYQSSWFGVLALLVPALLLGRYLSGGWREPAGAAGRRRAELLLVGFGWALLQTAALAYGRGGHGVPPVPRYMDMLSVVPLLTLFAWLTLILELPRARWRVAAVAGAALWSVLALAGLRTEVSVDMATSLPAWRMIFLRGEPNLRGYLATHDYARYLAGKSVLETTYPLPQRLAAILDDETLRPYLPADIRQPLRVQATGANDGPVAAFQPGGYDPACGVPGWRSAWGSYAPSGADARQGDLRARFTTPARLPYLRFEFAGYLGEPELRFSLRDAATGRAFDWQPHAVAREHWHREEVPAPGRDLQVDAADHSGSRWFAFSEPVEVGGWSRWTGFLLRQGGKVFLLGCLLMIGLEFWRRLAGRQLAFRPADPNRMNAAKAG